MNLPTAPAAPASVTSTSASSDVTADSTERCDDCGCRDAWVIHAARLRGTLRFFCTHCLLRNHPASFCPICFVVYDSSPTQASRRVSCTNCLSLTHTQCATNATSTSYLCPPCRNPTCFSFFRPIIGPDGGRSVDKALSEAFYCAAKISASSMNKAVASLKTDAERRGREAALARKRAREALEHVVILDAKEKTRSVIPKLKEASIEISGNRTVLSEQKPKLTHASNGTAKETESPATTTTKNSGGTEKQNQPLQLAKVKQEGDAYASK